MKPTIRIDVVSDIVCPWCYIGKRRLEKAIDRLKSEYEIEVEYHPFELNPSLPQSGVNQREYLIEKFGGEERYEQLTGRVSEVAAEEGLIFDYESQAVSPNTRKAHALLMLAREGGVQLTLMESFFNAYFTRGVDLSKDENLLELAIACGISSADAVKVLENPDKLMEVATLEAQMSKLGITGVPFYIINKKYGISGAQPTKHFIEVLKEASTEMSATDSCSVDGENC